MVEEIVRPFLANFFLNNKLPEALSASEILEVLVWDELASEPSGKKVDEDEANGVAQLRKEGMQVVTKVDGNSFREAMKGPYANYAKEFGADNIAAIQAVK